MVTANWRESATLNNVGRDQIKRCEARRSDRGGRQGQVRARRDTKRVQSRSRSTSAARSTATSSADAGAGLALHAAVPRRLLHGQGHAAGDRPADRLRGRARCRRTSPAQPIDAAPYNLNDGFSPGQAIVVRVPGLDTPEALAATNPVAARPTSAATSASERAGRRDRRQDRRALADLGRDRLQRADPRGAPRC